MGMWKNRNRHLRKCFTKQAVLLVTLALGGFTYLLISQNLVLVTPRPTQPQEALLALDEIKEILQNTPYLWRSSSGSNLSQDINANATVTVTSRIDDQRLWIQRISRTELIRNSPPKTILVRDGLDLSGGKVNCPYAPEFTEKCLLRDESLFYRLLGPLKYIGVDAETTVRNWDIKYTNKIPENVMQVMFIVEPPLVAKNTDLGVNNAVLASFWRGADIPTPYRRWVPNPPSEVQHLTATVSPLAVNRTRIVAAIISNCEKDRLNYIKALQKFIPVDVYGKCGKFSCPKYKNEDCLSQIGMKYKFFLAFENSNCEDYITEKFFHNALNHNLLPIVMGARPEDYETAAPPNSYIHVNDFKSPKELAKYIRILNEDDEKYKSYFKWRGTGKITMDGFADIFCRVCGMLFYSDFVPRPRWSGNANLKNVYESEHCLPKGAYQWSN